MNFIRPGFITAGERQEERCDRIKVGIRVKKRSKFLKFLKWGHNSWGEKDGSLRTKIRVQ